MFCYISYASIKLLTSKHKAESGKDAWKHLQMLLKFH